MGKRSRPKIAIPPGKEPIPGGSGLPIRRCQGKDEKEALENIREAITAWLWAEDQKAVAALPKGENTPTVVVAL